MRPHVVWFGETPFALERIYSELTRADLFLSIGTSGSVYPAAGLVAEARSAGLSCVELNLAPSDNHYLFTDSLYGEASRVVPEWVDGFLAHGQG